MALPEGPLANSSISPKAHATIKTPINLIQIAKVIVHAGGKKANEDLEGRKSNYPNRLLLGQNCAQLWLSFRQIHSVSQSL